MSSSAADDDEFNITGISHHRIKTSSSTLGTEHVVRKNPLYGNKYNQFSLPTASGTSRIVEPTGTLTSTSNKSVIGQQQQQRSGSQLGTTRISTVTRPRTTGAVGGGSSGEFGENVNAILTDLDEEEREVRNWRYQLSNDHF